MSEQVNFSSLNLPIPDIVNIYPYEKKREIFDYLFSMTEIEKEYSFLNRWFIFTKI